MQNNQQQNIEPLYINENDFKNDNYSEELTNPCFEGLLWLLTFIIWGFCIGSVFNSEFLLLAGSIYFIYIILELCFCCKCKIFPSVKSTREISEIMSSWFKASPTIEFFYTIYEYYEEEVTTEYGGKKIETDLRAKQVDTKNFNFFSSRDVTGPIIFSNENYSYIRFFPIPEIKFADEITYSDYKEEKSNFINSDHIKGDKYEYSEKRTIPGLRGAVYLINVYDSCTCFFTRRVFFIFTLLTFGQIYKLIMKFYIKNCFYRIRKIVSTRYDLSKDSKYLPFTPKLYFPNNNYTYNLEDFTQSNYEMNINPPTPDELTRSKQYQEYIPNFQLYQRNKRGLTESVIDIQKYPDDYQNYNAYDITNQNNNLAVNVNIKQANNNIPVKYQANQDSNQNKLYNESNINFPTNQGEGFFGKPFNK